MAKTPWYPAAKRADYSKKYPGDTMPHPNALVLHTTEGSSLVDYQGGAVAPTFTVWHGHGVWQHFPVNMSARALMHPAGTVPTNTLNVVQIEIIGTCAKGGPGTYWPDAGDVELSELAILLAWLNVEWGIPLTSTSKSWTSYPASYGTRAAQRMTDTEWLNFNGVCGHQHVPNNDHGDPGNFPTARLLTLAQAIVNPPVPPTPPPTPPTPPENPVTPDDVWNADIKTTAQLPGWGVGQHPVSEVLDKVLAVSYESARRAMELQTQVTELAAAVAALTPPPVPPVGA